ncbi:MAG: hypothetical protein ACYCVH_13940 [Ignavibacteriaceae bacterium]
MTDLVKLLQGGDLRSIGQSNKVVALIDNQEKFDELFQFLFHSDRKVVMRTADAIEKITIDNKAFLKKHKKKIIGLCNVAKDKELKWHLALLISRLHLDIKEFGKVWDTLTTWAKDKKNSRIVRVNSIQGLFEMMKQENELEKDFILTLFELEKENIPSINARIKNIRKQIERQTR